MESFHSGVLIQLMESFHSGVLITPTTPQNGIFEYNDLKLPTKEQLKFSR